MKQRRFLFAMPLLVVVCTVRFADCANTQTMCPDAKCYSKIDSRTSKAHNNSRSARVVWGDRRRGVGGGASLDV